MSWIVTPNLITINDADAITGWANQGVAVSVALAAEVDLNIQGAACVSWGLKSLGVYHFYYSSSIINLQNQHLYVWYQGANIKQLATYANKGVNILCGLGGAYSVNNIAGWVVDGSDTYPGGWKCYVLDTNRQPDWSGSGWTSTAIQNVGKVGMTISCSTASGKSVTNTYIDVMRYGTGLTIFSGSATTPANWEALYTSDFTASNKYGIIDKRSGVYFLQGPIQIGTGSNPTNFQDSSQIVQFEPKYVSGSHYKITLTGSLTTCSFGSVIGTSTSSIAVNPIIIRGSQDFTRTLTTGPGVITQSLRHPFIISPEVIEVQLYGSTFSDFKELNFGTSASAMNASKLKLVGNNFTNTFPITKNFNGTASLIYGNQLVSTTGSYNPISASHALLLLDTGSIDSSGIKILNSYGFTSVSSDITQSFTLSNHDFSSNTRYITSYINKTWNVVNPIWSAPTTNSLVFFGSASNKINEQYRYNTTVNDSALLSLSASKIHIYEGTLTNTIPYSFQTDVNGNSTFDITKVIYYASSSTLSPKTIISQSYGNFANKIYKYGYVPYISNLTVAAGITQNISLGTDSNITTANQQTALSNGIGISSTEYTSSTVNPVKVINYKSGSTLFPSGSQVTGSSSGANGKVFEYIGVASDGTLVLTGGNSTKFVENERLQTASISYSTSSVLVSQGGFSGSYTWMIDANSNTLDTTYEYLAAEMANWPISSSYNNVLVWGRGEQSQLIYRGASGYNTKRNTTTQRGVWISKIGTGTVEYLTSDEGNQYVPPVQYSITLTGLIAGTEVRIYTSGSQAEVAGVESSGVSFSYSYVYSADINIYIQILSLAYENIRLENLTLTNSNLSIPVQQRIDRNYLNPV